MLLSFPSLVVGREDFCVGETEPRTSPVRVRVDRAGTIVTTNLITGYVYRHAKKWARTRVYIARDWVDVTKRSLCT